MAGASAALARKIDIIGDPPAPTWHFGLVLLVAMVGATKPGSTVPLKVTTVPVS